MDSAIPVVSHISQDFCPYNQIGMNMPEEEVERHGPELSDEFRDEGTYLIMMLLHAMEGSIETFFSGRLMNADVDEDDGQRQIMEIMKYVVTVFPRLEVAIGTSAKESSPTKTFTIHCDLNLHDASDDRPVEERHDTSDMSEVENLDDDDMVLRRYRRDPEEATDAE